MLITGPLLLGGPRLPDEAASRRLALLAPHA